MPADAKPSASRLICLARFVWKSIAIPLTRQCSRRILIDYNQVMKNVRYVEKLWGSPPPLKLISSWAKLQSCLLKKLYQWPTRIPLKQLKRAPSEQPVSTSYSSLFLQVKAVSKAFKMSINKVNGMKKNILALTNSSLHIVVIVSRERKKHVDSLKSKYKYWIRVAFIIN